MATDIRHTRRLIAKRLDDAIEQLQELRTDIGTFERDDQWLADGLEIVLENISQLAAFADRGNFDDLSLDEDADTDDDSSLDEDLDDDGEEDLGDELNFENESFDD